MRSVALLCACFLLLGLLWSVQSPFASYGMLASLDDQAADAAGAEQELIKSGTAAVPALRNGLNSSSESIRLRCARILALRNDASGEQALLYTLRMHPDDAAGGRAEIYLLSVWDRRDGPDEATRARLAHFEATHADTEAIALLTECLGRDPMWVGGYIRRARLTLRAGEVMESRRDALIALALAPNQFEAMTVLAQIQLLLSAPQDAYTCFEQAVRINPRLKRDLREDIRELIKALDADKERRRRERRKESPAI